MSDHELQTQRCGGVSVCCKHDMHNAHQQARMQPTASSLVTNGHLVTHASFEKVLTKPMQTELLKIDDDSLLYHGIKNTAGHSTDGAWPALNSSTNNQLAGNTRQYALQEARQAAAYCVLQHTTSRHTTPMTPHHKAPEAAEATTLVIAQKMFNASPARFADRSLRPQPKSPDYAALCSRNNRTLATDIHSSPTSLQSTTTRDPSMYNHQAVRSTGYSNSRAAPPAGRSPAAAANSAA
jgi:hypothetical protein